MDRRQFLRSGTAFAAVLASTGATTLIAAPAGAQSPVVSNPPDPNGPYGSLAGLGPDANGLVLPPGFSSRVVAIGGEPVAGTGKQWHLFPDGGACFAAADRRWIYVSNSEVLAPGKGGVRALHFDATGSIHDVTQICSGTTMNGGGGATPWNTWLTCESHDGGMVWECTPEGGDSDAIARPALGTFRHEAAAVDPVTGICYLTEDHPTGLLYRFTPTARQNLASGTLHAARVGARGEVTWVTVSDPAAKRGLAQNSASGATRFNGGEGICVIDRTLVFTTKGTDQVHEIALDAMRYAVVRDAGPPLGGVGTIAADPVTGDLYVAEDGDNMGLALISADGVTAPFCRVIGHDGSEITGPAFTPDRTRLYFSSHRGPTSATIKDIVPEMDATTTVGITYEVTGPFRSPSTNPVSGARIVDRSGSGSAPATGASAAPMAITLGAGAVALVVGGAVAVRRRIPGGS